MAENSRIAWTDHTVNFWWGCTEDSPACANCYARIMDAQYYPTKAKADRAPGEAAIASHWGDRAPRLLRVQAAGREALRYEKRAVREGTRFRVFCSSMADCFEDRRDLDVPRMEFLDVVRTTPHLDWLLLTKRPEAILRLLDGAIALAVSAQRMTLAEWLVDWVKEGRAPQNVALGTTVESQDWAAPRLDALLQVPARTHFVSVEPMLGPVDLRPWLHREGKRLDWVICGGESGKRARPMLIDWALALQVHCEQAGVAFFMKQLSEAGWPSTFEDFDTFPAQLQVREFPLSA